MVRTHGWRGSPPRDDAEARERIIGAAMRCIDRYGSRTRLADVAKELGVTRQTVYFYFAGTEELLVATAQQAVGGFLDALAAHVAPLEEADGLPRDSGGRYRHMHQSVRELCYVLDGEGVCIMHAASQDLEILARVCGTLPSRLFDTQVAAGFVGYSSVGLADGRAGAMMPYSVSVPITRWTEIPSPTAGSPCGRPVSRPPVSITDTGRCSPSSRWTCRAPGPPCPARWSGCT